MNLTIPINQVVETCNQTQIKAYIKEIMPLYVNWYLFLFFFMILVLNVSFLVYYTLWEKDKLSIDQDILIHKILYWLNMLALGTSISVLVFKLS